VNPDLVAANKLAQVMKEMKVTVLGKSWQFMKPQILITYIIIQITDLLYIFD